MKLEIASERKRQVIDITGLIQDELSGNGLANIFLRHTTAAITLSDLDPGTDQDILDAIEAMTPLKAWRHPHDPSHFPDHLWSTLIGNSLTIPFKSNALMLGSWQRLVLIELDGPRKRQLELTLLKG